MTEKKPRRQEKQRRRRETIIIAVIIVLVVLLTSVLVFFTGMRGEALMPENLLVFSLTNLNAILLLLLIFLVVRNVVKLFFELRRGIWGSRLRTKLVIAFVGLSLVPTLLLFWVSIGFISNTIENWFSFKVENSLEEAFSVAEVYYNTAGENALYYGRQISAQITASKLLNEANLEELKALVAAKQVEYKLGVVEVFSSQQEELLKVMNPKIPDKSFISAESELVRQGMVGREVIRVQPAGEGDIIRGVVPVHSTWKHSDIVGVVVVNYYIEQSLVGKMDTIQRAFQEYKQLKIYKKPIKRLYVILLSVVTLLIVFSATWFGFHLSKVITVPISSLAEATTQVAQGNLDFQIEEATDDEIGALIKSFNQMTCDLRSSNRQVEITTGNLRDTIRELDHRRRYVEILLDNVAAGVVSLNTDGVITACNKSAERMLQVQEPDVVGRRYAEALDADALQHLREFIREITERQMRALERQLTLAFPSTTVFLYVRSTMLFDGEGNSIGLVLVAEDLTHLQQAQRAFAWREVARRIAHEVKNPLTPIKLSAQRLRKKFGPQIEQDYKVFDECTATIIDEVDQLKVMVNEFSNFARMPATNPVPNDLNTIIEETLVLYREAHKQVAFNFHADREIAGMSLDRDQIKRAMINLLDNALASMDNDGTVTVTTTRDKRRDLVTIEVADTGCGVPAAIKPKLFEPYFSTRKEGTGLGLAIVNTIVSDHGGYVRVRDNKPSGTCFVIELPVSRTVTM